MATLLTPQAVKRMKTTERKLEVRDKGCPGLILVIYGGGQKSWQMRVSRPGGGQARITLGPVDLTDDDSAGSAEPRIGTPLKLAAARRLASSLSHQRAMGQDVVGERHRARLEQEARGAKTFAPAAVDFVEQHSRRKVRGWKQQARSLGLRPTKDGAGMEPIPRGLSDRWRDLPLADIDGDDIHAIVREVREKGVPGLGRRNKGPSDPRARAMFADLSKFFAWCVEERRLKSNPVIGVAKPKPPAARDRVLSDQELVWFWKACDSMTAPFGPCFRLLLLLGCRLNEAAGMRRSEFSEDGKVWTIPSARSKNHRSHEVPLSPLALEILEGVQTSGDLVFSTNGRSAISGWSKTKKKLDEAMLKIAREEATAAGRDARDARLAPWRIHDLRRTCASKMGDLGIAPHVIESVLNHVSGTRAGVSGVYNRSSYMPERKAALERWAAHVAGLVAGRASNVVPMQRAEA